MGRPPKVTAEVILDAAALVPAEDLSLAAVAAILGVAVRTIYNYFPNRADLVRALTARAIASIEPPDMPTNGDWSEALRRNAWWTYRLAQKQPEWALHDAGSRQAVVGRAFLPCVTILRDSGFTPAAAMTAYLAVSNFAYGMAGSAVQTDRAGGLDSGNIRAYVNGIDDQETLDAIATTMSSQTTDGWFEAGLEVVIAGVHTHLAPLGARSRGRGRGAQ